MRYGQRRCDKCQSYMVVLDIPDDLISYVFAYLSRGDRDKLASLNPRFDKISKLKQSNPSSYAEHRRIPCKLAQWGSQGKDDGQFHFPIDIAVFKGEVFVSDKFNSRIQVFSQDGIFLRKWSYEYNQKRIRPRGIVVSENQVFVTDDYLEQIFVFSHEGRFIRRWSCEHPCAIRVHENNLYVLNGYTREIRMMSQTGQLLQIYSQREIEEEVYFPILGQPVVYDDELFICQPGSNRIVKYESPESIY